MPRRMPRAFRRPLAAALLAVMSGIAPCLAQELLPPPPAAMASPPGALGSPVNPFAPLPEGAIVGPGGAIVGPGGPVVGGPPPAARNSVVIPPLDAELVWMKLVDVTDDYFKINAEQRVVFAGGVPTEGRIETFPQTGATLLEPWRADSVGFRERLEATLQSIRRIGLVRMIPDPNGWRIEVTVDKELEYLSRPMRATTGGASFRNDDSLYRYGTPLPTLGQQVGDQPRPVAAPTPNLGWIPLGRDPLLEQRILSRVLAKLGVAPLPQPEPYYQPPQADTGLVLPPAGPGPATLQPGPAAPGPMYGAPITREQLPPGAVIAPGPPVPIESLPLPR
jgi:hypothetical protein